MAEHTLLQCVARALAVAAVLLMVPQAAIAAIIEYRLTFEGVLRNPNGSWGGNLPAAAARRTNLTVIFRYLRAEDGSSQLQTLQVVDNTRGLASARFFAISRLIVDYDFDGATDRFTGADGNRPGGFLIPEVERDFGSVGDPLPAGASFDARVNARVMPIVMALAPARGDEVQQQDLQPGSFVFSSRALPDPVLDLLHCPADVDGDATSDLIAITLAGRVVVRSLDGRLINHFGIGVGEELLDVELMPDTNGNGAPELVVLRRGSARAEVRDLLTSARLGTIDFDPSLAPVDLLVTGDRSGNGIPELALLGFDPVSGGRREISSTVEVRDGMSGAPLERIDSVGWAVPKALDLGGDSNHNGETEFLVLGEHVNRIRPDSIRISDTVSRVRDIWLGRRWTMLGQERISGISGNRTVEMAVLRVLPPRAVNVQIRDTGTGQWVSTVGFPVEYPPQGFLVIGDMNGNRASELVVLGSRFDGSEQRAVIKDGRTGARLSVLRFDSTFPGLALADCGDINGNGAHDVALLGERARDGRRKVTVLDGRTGARLAQVLF